MLWCCERFGGVEQKTAKDISNVSGKITMGDIVLKIEVKVAEGV